MIKVIGFGLYFIFYGLIFLLVIILFDMFWDICGDEIKERFGGDKDDGA